MTHPACQPVSRDAIAQALLDRFIERGSVRFGGYAFPPGTKIQTLVRSYRDDFYADADAILALPSYGVQNGDDKPPREAIEDVIRKNPYTNCSFVAQNSVIETNRAHRYARMIALEVVRALSLPDDSDLQAAHQRIQELQGENDRLSSLLPSADSRGGK